MGGIKLAQNRVKAWQVASSQCFQGWHFPLLYRYEVVSKPLIYRIPRICRHLGPNWAQVALMSQTAPSHRSICTVARILFQYTQYTSITNTSVSSVRTRITRVFDSAALSRLRHHCYVRFVMVEHIIARALLCRSWMYKELSPAADCCAYSSWRCLDWAAACWWSGYWTPVT